MLLTAHSTSYLDIPTDFSTEYWVRFAVGNFFYSYYFELNMAEPASSSPVAAEQGQIAPTQGTHLVADVRAIISASCAIY